MGQRPKYLNKDIDWLIFKIGNKWLQLFQFGANFSHLAKVMVQEKKQPEGTLSDPKEITLKNFIKSHQMMLHAKYECFSPYGLSQEDFKRFLS